MSNEYQVRVITPPAVEPVSLAECKVDLRVDQDADNDLIASLIAGARQDAEELSRRALVNRTLELSLTAWPCDNLIRLPFPPLVSVTAITYLSDANVSAVMPSTDYYAVTDVEPGLITLAKDKTWPTATLRSLLPIRVRYVAGYGATAVSVPERYKALIRSLVAIRYEYRDEMTPTAERQLANIRAALQMDWGW
jgi:uncharacterized phiE125 gp8 family phage protein